MITSRLIILIISIVLFLDLIVLVYLLTKKGGKQITEDDNDFIKYNFDKATTEMQKNLINGTKMAWNTFDFLLNKKGYHGELDDKMSQAEKSFQNFMALKAQRNWSLDLKSDDYVKPEQLENFISILKTEITAMGVKL